MPIRTHERTYAHACFVYIHSYHLPAPPGQADRPMFALHMVHGMHPGQFEPKEWEVFIGVVAAASVSEVSTYRYKYTYRFECTSGYMSVYLYTRLRTCSANYVSTSVHQCGSICVCVCGYMCVFRVCIYIMGSLWGQCVIHKLQSLPAGPVQTCPLPFEPH